LVTDRRRDFYRCATEKMLIYALGRGIETQDMHTIDLIVDKLEAAEGRPSVLLRGIIESPAFQRRGQPADRESPAAQPSQAPIKVK
jgi:hypothetical protein